MILVVNTGCQSLLCLRSDTDIVGHINHFCSFLTYLLTYLLIYLFVQSVALIDSSPKCVEWHVQSDFCE